MVEGKLGLWEQVVPPVRTEGDVVDREDGDEMVFGGTYGTFRVPPEGSDGWGEGRTER